MGESCEEVLTRAMAMISQSDPIIKLLQQVHLGRMKPTDAGLRAITESWLGTYEKAVGAEGLTASDLRRIDPKPRLAVLMDAGVLHRDHPGAISLITSFEQAMAHSNAR